MKDEPGNGWYEPADPTFREACPCCDYVTLPERGSSLICKVCFWEDDMFSGDQLDEWSMCNGMTLATARANFVAIGACDARMLQHVVSLKQRAMFKKRMP